MNTYFAYIRVSTVRQGALGSSLQEQRAAIEAFAARNGLTVGRWYEEMETAAKLGRTAFNKMIAEVERGRARGIIIHKIDRSARNLKDWARLGELMDRGFDVRFVHDNLDLSTRGGRLAADLQAVVAADYIRNLRDEVNKGIYGRLKQGFYPRAAPVGYLNCGKAKAKAVDPVKGPLVRTAFELYGSSTYSLQALREEMARRGLATSAGRPLPLGNIGRILHNPFYMGLMLVPRTGELFQGNHDPLVTRRLFDRVQGILAGKTYPRIEVHQFRFRRLITCAGCGRSLTGERQKGMVYYRCHSFECRGTSLDEDSIDAFVRAELAKLWVDEGEVGEFRDEFRRRTAQEAGTDAERTAAITRDIHLVEERLARLTDALLDGTIERDFYLDRKGALLRRKVELENQREAPPSTFWQVMAERFERGLTAHVGYDFGNDGEKREIVICVGSNFQIRQKEPVLTMFQPFQTLREVANMSRCEPDQGAVRTLMQKLTSLRETFSREELNLPSPHDETSSICKQA